MLKTRERLERQCKFQIWFRHQRFIESLTDEQLQFLRVTGWTDAPEPRPGASPLDNLSRQELRKLWEESERMFGGRSSEQLGFFADHGHWPEAECSERNCSKNEFDDLKKKFATQIKNLSR